MKKILIISDKNSKSSKIKILLEKKIKNYQFKQKNLIIVIGGDGFMLETLKKYKNSKKIFYGINSGNYGFLMNKFSLKNIIKNLSKAKMITISPLEMIVKNNKNKNKKNLAIPLFIIFLAEIFPLKTSGSFFTTTNSVFLFFVIAFIVSLTEYKTDLKNL